MSNDPQDPAVWPPPVSRVDAPPIVENTSGEKTTVPVEILTRRRNWAGLVLGPVWAFGNGLAIYGWMFVVLTALEIEFVLGARTPSDVAPWFACAGVDLLLRLFLFFTGLRLAWRANHYPYGVSEFLTVQRKWNRAAVIVAAVCVVTVGVMAYQSIPPTASDLLRR